MRRPSQSRDVTYALMPIEDITLDHVAVAVPSVRDAHARWVHELGGADLRGGDNGTFEAHEFRYANGGKLELIQPSSYAGAQGFVASFLAKFGAGIHHITFKVRSIADALDAVESHGLQAVDKNVVHDHWKEAFLRPSQVGRIVIQIAESAFSDADWERFAEAPLPHAAPWAPSLIGPLLGVESMAWAERLYSGLLGGAVAKDAAGRLTFGWPDSPLVVTVVEDEPGARGLLVDGWDGSLPAHPRFGPPVRPR